MLEYLDWQNNISSDATIVPLFYVADYRISPVDKIIKDDEELVKLCNYTDVYKNSYITSDLEFMNGSATKNEIDRFEIKDGDILITKDSESSNDIGIPAFVEGHFTETTVCGYHLALIRAKKSLVVPKFLYYCFESKQHRLQLEIEATGVTRFGIPKNSIGKYKIPFSAISKQHQIVEYLDKELAKIDALIEKKTKLVEVLNEKKKAVINQAVTKGINPNVPMKDPGIEWFGEIPEHWEVTRMKFLTNKVGSGLTPSGGANVYTDSGVLFLRSQNIYNDRLKLEDQTFIPEYIHENMKSSQVKKKDILLNITGGSIGRCYFFDLEIEANINQHVCIIRVNEGVFYKYLHFALISIIGQYQIDQLQYGGGREAISFENIKNFIIPFPSIKEQIKIVDFIEKEFFKLNEIILKVTEANKLLLEKRIAIISAAINGELNLIQYES